jgi:hypothetical protein
MFDNDINLPRSGYSEKDNPIEIMERAVNEDE